MLQGGCYCRAIRYETSGPTFHETHCHCSICRRTTGGSFVTWFSVSKNDFRWLVGEPTLFQSSSHGTRSFCPTCGTQVLFEDERFPDEVDVSATSLDDPERITPRDHTQVRTRLSYIVLADDLPEYPAARD